MWFKLADFNSYKDNVNGGATLMIMESNDTTKIYQIILQTNELVILN